jgi:hypothetical protein
VTRDARFFHDVRAPLARAQTYAKLLDGAQPSEAAELLLALRTALDDLDARLREAESGDAAGED